jgi:hypothetical protein
MISFKINLSYRVASPNTGFRHDMIQLFYHVSYLEHQMGLFGVQNMIQPKTD